MEYSVINMAKANKKIDENMNFWDLRIVHGHIAPKLPRVGYRQLKENKKKKKVRQREEQKAINESKFHKKPKVPLNSESKKNKMEKVVDQIKYGFDLAKWFMLQHE